MARVGDKAASSFGVGSGPSPEMLPHPWQQPPPWVSATRLGTPSPPLLWLQRNRGRGQGWQWGPVSFMCAGPGHILGARLWML